MFNQERERERDFATLDKKIQVSNLPKSIVFVAVVANFVQS